MTSIETPFGPLSLEREPASADSSLRAWDAADLQLLATLEGRPSSSGAILVINDSFGALALGAGLAAMAAVGQPSFAGTTDPHGNGVSAAPAAIYSWGDSFTAHLATCRNAHANQLPMPIPLPSSAGPEPAFSGPAATNVVLWRIPKSLALLANQIARVRRCVDSATTIWLGAMQKHVPQRAVAFLERHLGPMQRQRLQGKAIIWRAQLDPDRPLPESRVASLRLPCPELTLESDPAVFNGGRLDAGTELLLAHRRRWPIARHAADLGCGNGVLGLALAAMQPEVSLWGLDDSYQAIASAQRNARQSRFANLGERLHFSPAHVFTYALPGEPPRTLPAFDLILCNPPFHQQHVVGDHIAWLMFQQSKAHMAPEGELWIVGNRHLDYHRKLKRLFGNCELIDSDRRFVVLRSRR